MLMPLVDCSNDRCSNTNLFSRKVNMEGVAVGSWTCDSCGFVGVERDLSPSTLAGNMSLDDYVAQVNRGVNAILHFAELGYENDCDLPDAESWFTEYKDSWSREDFITAGRFLCEVHPDDFRAAIDSFHNAQ
jgi:hypothetical protein